MDPDATPNDFEPIVAHGARMSWAGLLRPGDEFGPPRRSRRAVLSAASGPGLRREFGAWSSRYHRFTSNLSSPDLTVRLLDPGEAPGVGVCALVHWVDRATVHGWGPGSVCGADGWPVELWQRFVRERDHLPGRTIAEQLRAFAFGPGPPGPPIVEAWRNRIRPGDRSMTPTDGSLGPGWLPVPASLESPAGSTACIVSWSPSPLRFASLSEALDSPFALEHPPDRTRQAEYYLECVLARLHDVRFGADDRLEDPTYERSTEVRRLIGPWKELEARRIADERWGRLDRRG